MFVNPLLLDSSLFIVEIFKGTQQSAEKKFHIPVHIVTKNIFEHIPPSSCFLSSGSGDCLGGSVREILGTVNTVFMSSSMWLALEITSVHICMSVIVLMDRDEHGTFHWKCSRLEFLCNALKTWMFQTVCQARELLSSGEQTDCMESKPVCWTDRRIVWWCKADPSHVVSAPVKERSQGFRRTYLIYWDFP